MQIADHAVVSLNYTLTDSKGQVLDTADDNHPFAYLHGAQNIIAGLEEALEGKQQGDELKVTIPPERAYGEYREDLLQEVPREMFAGMDEEHLVPGSQFQAQTDQGMEIVTIAKVEDEVVTIDGNHPLAGETLTFDVVVGEVRAATEEEIEHGHAHQAGGHEHDEHD